MKRPSSPYGQDGQPGYMQSHKAGARASLATPGSAADLKGYVKHEHGDGAIDAMGAESRRKRNKFSSADVPLLPLPTPNSSIGSYSQFSQHIAQPPPPPPQQQQSGVPFPHTTLPPSFHRRSYSSAVDGDYAGSSPYAYSNGPSAHGPPRFTGSHSAPGSATQANAQSGSRGSSGSFPTPAPTTISDEDVAMQLIRLGDPSLSPFKCPSEKSSSPLPVLTTAMQLKALHDGVDFAHVAKQVAGGREHAYPSSPPSSVESGGGRASPKKTTVQPAAQRQGGAKHNRSHSLYTGDDHAMRARNLSHDTLSNASNEDDVPDERLVARHDGAYPPHAHHGAYPQQSHASTYGHAHAHAHAHVHSASAGDQPHKTGRSIGVRCIRCKKSKKGCDRQRPCGRCADADEECITEDESSGRKARAGGIKKQKRP